MTRTEPTKALRTAPSPWSRQALELLPLATTAVATALLSSAVHPALPNWAQWTLVGLLAVSDGYLRAGPDQPLDIRAPVARALAAALLIVAIFAAYPHFAS